MDKRNILISREPCPSRMNSNNKYYNRVYAWHEDYGYDFIGEFTDMQDQQDFLEEYAEENGFEFEDLNIEIVREFSKNVTGILTGLKNSDAKKFSLLWEQVADEYDWFDFAKSIRGDLTFDQWDHAWQYCLINHPDFNQAQREFLMAINKTY